MAWSSTYVTVNAVRSDLYDYPYSPKETILALAVTSSNITARLLGRTEDGGFAPLAGMTIHIYELVNNAWIPVGDFVTDDDGVVSISRTNTQEWYKAVFDGTDEYQPATAYAQLQAQPPEQPPPPQQQQQQVCAATACNVGFWLLLLLLALLLGRRREEETSI
jgi:predicted cobalt transporter CbtA